MRLPNNKTDMISQIAQETGRSRELVNLVIKNFEKSLRYHLSNPIDTGVAIMLKGFGKFIFDKEAAKKRMNKLTHKRKVEFYKDYFKRFDNE